MDCSPPDFPVHHQLPELTHVHPVGDAIQPSHHPCCPLLLPPSVFLSISVFSNESVLRIRWTHQAMWLIHADVWQKPTQHGKAVILQLKMNFQKCPVSVCG